MLHSFESFKILRKLPLEKNVSKSLEWTVLARLSTSHMIDRNRERKEEKVKPFEEIPAKGGILPSWLDLILIGGACYLHEHCDRRHRNLGPIFRESLGPVELTFVADTNLFRSILANEGKYPVQNVPPVWLYYNKVRNVERGLFFQFGQPWSKMRHAMNRVMLSKELINQFTGSILKINDDLIDHWAGSGGKDMLNDKITIRDLKQWLCKWSLESTGFILFGHRMGCFPLSGSSDLQAESEASKLVGFVSDMFRETSKFQILPVEWAHRLNLNVWRRFETASDNMLRVANDLTKKNMDSVMKSDSREKLSLVRKLMDSRELSHDEISRSVVDLIIAAADTTSNSLQWVLYSLASNTEMQDRILDEVRRESETENSPGKWPYLNAFLKESLRLYPTAPFLARTLDRDITLAGYHIPAGKPLVLSLYTSSRMEIYFSKPDEFMPERWLHNHTKLDADCPRDRAHAFASLPFGFGSRNCIGRRVAELAMNLFIASLIKKFRVSLADGEKIGIKLKMILEPDRPICINLEPRSRLSN